jgi:hypothetical protein
LSVSKYKLLKEIKFKANANKRERRRGGWGGSGGGVIRGCLITMPHILTSEKIAHQLRSYRYGITVSLKNTMVKPELGKNK